MLIAGEASGDMLAGELVTALRQELTAAEVDYTTDSQPLRTGLEPRFFGAGGPRMAAAGVDLISNLTDHSIIGVPSPRSYLQSRKRFHELLRAAIERQPDVIIGVDYNYFNLRFADSIRNYTNHRRGWFQDWHPKLVKYISPQVWASRENRVHQIARDYDLILSIFPFEKDWYARRAPGLRVEFVGHPMVDRFVEFKNRNALPRDTGAQQILLLPGSRVKELQRHLPVMQETLRQIRKELPGVRAKMVLPARSLIELASKPVSMPDFEIQLGNLPEALASADLAIASTGTVTMECAFFGVPTVTLYKTSWVTYELGKRIVKVKSLTMPNLLAGEEIFPEFIQNQATPANISRAALDLLRNNTRRSAIQSRLAEIVSSLGGPGASRRAAQAIAQLLEAESKTNRVGQRKLVAAAN